MDLVALQVFVKVVQTGSFTRAASSLGSQKSHLSRTLSQLERELGVRLLERTTRALSLTEAGREFFERALAILGAVDDARRAMQKVQGVPRGSLRLTCGVEFGMIAVSSWIERYLEHYPDVRIDADYTARVVDLVHEGYDLAIRLGSLSDSSLAARKLGELHYALYAAPRYLSRRGSPQHPTDLSTHAQLAFVGGSHPAHWRLRRDQEEHLLNLQARLKANNVFAIRDAAIAGYGIAQLPKLVAAEAVQSGRLQVVLPGWEPPRVAVHAVFASVRYLTPKVRAFIDLAVEAMATGAGHAETAKA